ncbi:hypothetical protein Taro_032213 [Colocasia esculenta]|uniref:Uncharacterized protein n=1 Tax=Colocasia esculenta TaxID=4460 RepID=A0A843W8S7_COLES|nr:hypothetical protein [Colocasia esculenta]
MTGKSLRVSKEIVTVTYRVVVTSKSLRALKKSLRVVVTSKSLRALKEIVTTGSSVSTQSVVVSTLDPTSRRPFLRNWDSVDTLSGSVDTLRLKLKNVNFSEHVDAWGSRESA